jgi:glycosyltransferase involved in cell wall biosynthesis
MMMNSNNVIDFSVVVPVFNSEAALEELYDRLDKVFLMLEKTYEIIFINDGSRDRSYSVLRELYKKHPEKIIVVDLAKNFGQHNATMCGFNICTGSYVITIDDDLQNPPEEIVKLYRKISEGYDAVFGIPLIKEHDKYKNLGSYFLRRMNHRIFGIKNDLKFSSFRIIKKEIVDELKEIKTPFPYIPGMLMNITRSIANENVNHELRKSGKSNYNMRRLVRLAFNLLINYSTIPLKFIGTIGLVISVLSFLIGAFYAVKKIFEGTAPEGWTTIVVLISFYNAVVLIMVFFIGLYISRMLREVSRERQYSIRTILKNNINQTPVHY